MITQGINRDRDKKTVKSYKLRVRSERISELRTKISELTEEG